MKPTFQTSRPSRSGGASRPLRQQISQRPITDWGFQASIPELRGVATPFHPGVPQRLPLRPSFYTLSQGFFSAEANRESRFEGALFGIIAALSAWPIALAAQAAFALIK